MSLGLTLRADLPAHIEGHLFEPLADFLESHAAPVLRSLQEYEDESGGTLTADLHPAAGEVEFTWDQTHLTVSANTATAGPGYHAYLCQLLSDLAADWNITWFAQEDEGDDTGYFDSHDFPALQSALPQWLQSTCAAVLDFDRSGFTQIGLPAGSSFQYHAGLITPLGPRPWSWAEQVAAGEISGDDFFRLAHARNRCNLLPQPRLCLLWSEVRWKAPTSDEEARVLTEVDACLSKAQRLNPGLLLPVHEWNEVRAYLDLEPIHTLQPLPDTPIGYRRRFVREALAQGWSVSLPGNIDGAWDEGTWSGGNEDLTVHITLFTNTGPKAAEWTEEALGGARQQEGDQQWDFNEHGLTGSATLSESVDEDGPFFQLNARLARPGKLAVVSIAFPDESQLDTALRIWKSFRSATDAAAESSRKP